MANLRQEDKDKKSARDTVRNIRESTEAETSRIGETAAEAGQDVARLGTDAIQRNAETVQNVLRSGLEMATTVMGRSNDQVSRTLGLSGDEAQKAAQRSADSAAAILHSTSAAARVVSSMSQEYFAFVGRQVERGMDNINELSRCRTPQDFVAIQAELLQQAIQSGIECSRRIADMWVKFGDEAARRKANGSATSL